MKGRLLFLLLLAASVRNLQASTPELKPFLVLTQVSGESDTLYAGDNGSISYEAPLQVEFNAGIPDDAGASVYTEWNVTRSWMDGDVQEQEDYLKRQEPVMDYEFEDYGSFTVQFAWSYRPDGETDIIEGEEVQAISFSIDDSSLEIPNAFSPNGDGINDVFKVKVRSITSFKMSIFTRWGKLVKTGNQDNLEYEGDEGAGYYICWDGTYGGSTVADGVYFINIEAKGAGGKTYSRKRDINVLKGLGNESGNEVNP